MVARKKGTNNPEKIIPILEVHSGSDLPVRLEKISAQTGLSPHNLLQKWMLQEETLIGIMQSNKEAKPAQAETQPDVDPQKNTDDQRKSTEGIPSDPGSPNYRKMLIKRIQKLKKEGMTLKKIAETFNEEKVLTVSGAGKWYSSSIANLMQSKK